MAREKSPWLRRTETIFVVLTLRFIRTLPTRLAETLVLVVIKTSLFFIPKRRQLVMVNIQRALPEKSLQECQTIVSASLRNLARGTVAFTHLPQILKSTSNLNVQVEGREYLEESLKRGKGVMAINAHYGCWELSSAVTMRDYPLVAAAYRPLDNDDLNAFVTDLRQSTGGQLIPRRKVLREGIALLRKNGILGFLIDQRFPDGIPVDFFGIPALTVTVVSLLARRTGAAVHPAHSRWEGDTLRMIWEPEMILSTHPDAKTAVQEDTQAMTAVVERWVREDPTQWLWLHNRWKI